MSDKAKLVAIEAKVSFASVIGDFMPGQKAEVPEKYANDWIKHDLVLRSKSSKTEAGASSQKSETKKK